MTRTRSTFQRLKIRTRPSQSYSIVLPFLSCVRGQYGSGQLFDGIDDLGIWVSPGNLRLIQVLCQL